MKTKFFYSMVIVFGLMFAGATIDNVNGQTHKKATTTKTIVSKQYTCPEHPDVVMNKPGKCPKCGMALVEKKDMKKGKMDMKKESTTKKSTTKEKAMPM